ncbi:MAG: hypothetical protein LW629_06810 [Burkholderiales bacterium]|jgi:hypothetical protein|nr:hypothetical protein [Burkholderiales bacterium]
MHFHQHNLQAVLKTLLLSLLCASQQASASEFTMENNMMSTMETAMTRRSSVNYEQSVTWGRDSNFNMLSTVQPGWQLNATAIGNLINVQMSGAGNTAVINAMQINQGYQQASINLGANGPQNVPPQQQSKSTNPTPSNGGVSAPSAK